MPVRLLRFAMLKYLKMRLLTRSKPKKKSTRISTSKFLTPRIKRKPRRRNEYKRPKACPGVCGITII